MCNNACGALYFLSPLYLSMPVTHCPSSFHFDFLSSSSKTAELVNLMFKNGKHWQPLLHARTCGNACTLHRWDVKLAAISQEIQSSNVSRARELSDRDVSVHISLYVPLPPNITHISQSQPGQVIRQQRRTDGSAMLSSYI